MRDLVRVSGLVAGVLFVLSGCSSTLTDDEVAIYEQQEHLLEPAETPEPESPADYWEDSYDTSVDYGELQHWGEPDPGADFDPTKLRHWGEPEALEHQDPSPPRTWCVDVTSIDWDWDNDMLCTRPDGSRFYTSYEGATAAESGY